MSPLFPGGVAVSSLRVYDWESEDGLRGGSPHLHTASSEGYVVTAGSGEVHTVSAEGRGSSAERASASRSVRRLEPGEVVGGHDAPRAEASVCIEYKPPG